MNFSKRSLRAFVQRRSAASLQRGAFLGCKVIGKACRQIVDALLSRDMLNLSVQDLPQVYVIAVIIGLVRYPFDTWGHNPRHLPRGLIYQEPLGVGGGFIQLTSYRKNIPMWRCMQPESTMSATT